MSKKQWKSIDVPLQFSIKSDWSQEEVDAPLSDVHTIRSSLPTKTNATRQTAELDNIPENGPFILNFANMSFDATETDLKQFFRAYQIFNIELNNPRRGCGHIEFTNINDLAGAWKMNEKTFINRPIRLSIPLKEDMARQQAMGNKPKFQSQQKPTTFNSDDSDNWRSKKPEKIEKEPIAVNKPEESANWRDRVIRTEDNAAESNSGDQSAWRTRAPADQKTKPETSITTDNSAWRSQAPREAPGKLPDGGAASDNSVWRSQAPREAPGKLPDSGSASDKSAWRNKPSRQTDSARTVDSDDKVNWRPRGHQQMDESDTGSDCWRKGGPGVTEARPLPKSDSHGPVTVADDHGHTVADGDKKRSVFGDARPVDTMAKDLEIEAKLEAKLEHTKLTVEAARQDPVTIKANVWTKTPSTPEWREKKPTSQPNIVKESVKVELHLSSADQLPKKVELHQSVAPVTTVNVWQERLKTKNVPATGANKSPAKKDEGNAVSDDRHSIEPKKKEETVARVTEEGTVCVKKEGIVCVKKEETLPEAVCVRDGSGEEREVRKVAQGTAVVISVNGPFIDPKSHRTTATGLHSSGGNDSRVGSGANSSWARGPPKGLIDHHSTSHSCSGVDRP